MLRRIFYILFVMLMVGGILGGEDVHARSSKKAVKPAAYVVSARSALLMDFNSGRKLYAKEMTRKILPASTTKVMTALLVLERLDLDAYVTVSRKAAAALPTKIYLQAGDQYRVRDLLYATLLKSANDASLVLAEAVAGSEDKFVAMMNRRAHKIGARTTLFANPHGLPDDDPQYSTAYDMALIFREAMKKPFFREVIKEKYKKIRSKAGKVIILHSHNKGLFKGWKHDVYGKTGWTQAAKACFVGYFEKDGKKSIIAVFGCGKRWEDIKYIIEKYGKLDL